MGNAVKWIVLGCLAALPIAGKLLDEAISFTPHISKGVDQTIDYAKPEARQLKSPKLTNPIIQIPRSEPITRKSLDGSKLNKIDDHKQVKMVKDCISGVADCSMKLEVPTLFPKSNVPNCGSAELRNQLRKELKELTESDSFSAYAELKAHEKISDIFTKKIVSQNPISVEAKFLEQKLVVSIELPCGIENIGIDF